MTVGRRAALAAAAVAALVLGVAFFQGGSAINIAPAKLFLQVNGADDFASVMADLDAAQAALSSARNKLEAWCKPGHPHFDPAICPTTTTSSTTTTTVAPTTTTTVAPTTTTTVPPPTTTTTLPPPTTTTTAPTACVGVQVAAGSNLATLATNNPVNTTFCLASGVYVVNPAIAAKDGQDWIGALGPQGQRLSILTGNDSTQYAFATTAPNVRLLNIIIEHFENPIQRSTLQGINASRRNWLIDNVEARENLGIGLSVNHGGIIRNSFIHHNLQMGLGGWCGHGAEANCLIENNEVSFNNYQGLVDPGFEAGGSKWVGVEAIIIRGNNFHHNCGPGIWLDGDQLGQTIIEGNTATSNAGAGIFWEINDSPASAVIRNNTVIDNAFGTLGSGGPVCYVGEGGGVGGIVVTSSADTEVHGNTVTGNDGGIAGYSDARVGGPCPSSGCVLTGLWVHDNNVTYTVGWSGVRDFTGPNAAYGAAANNRFDRNHYHVGGLAQPFQWNDALQTWTAWRGFGHDLAGSID